MGKRKRDLPSCDLCVYLSNKHCQLLKRFPHVAKTVCGGPHEEDLNQNTIAGILAKNKELSKNNAAHYCYYLFKTKGEYNGKRN